MAASPVAVLPCRNVSRLVVGAAVLPLAVVLLPVMVLGDTSVTVAAPADEVSGIPASYLRWYVRGGRICPQVPWNVLAGVGEVESGHGANTGPSSAGAIGPMQFLPSTWRRWGRDANGDGRADLFEPADAISSAARYLCFYARRFDSVELALAAYNAGPASVTSSGGGPAQARTYVDRVLSRGTPIVAPFAGRAVIASNALGGLAVAVNGAEGYVYNAHLTWIGALGPVQTGDVIGYVGNSGDAQGGPTHDHFEWHPHRIPSRLHVSPYGASVIDGAVDPYPLLKEVC